MTPILVATIIIFLVFEIYRIIWSIVQSTKMANTMRPFSQKVAAPRKKVLYLGDSTGLGVGTTDSKYSVPGRIGTDYPDINLENNSANGRKSSDLVKVLEKYPEQKVADVIIIAIGGADILYFVPLSKVAAAFAKAIDLAKQRAQKVLLIAPNNAGLSPMFRNSFLDMLYTRRSRHLHEKLAHLTTDKNIETVDLFREKSEDALAQNPKKLYGRDNSHPSNDGYEIWYEIIRKKLAESLS